MRLLKVQIENFKAIKSAELNLADFTAIVGANGSGKSSILQALHWMFESGRNRTIEARKKKSEGATLSERDATFMPSPDYRNSANGHEYGNKNGSPQLDMNVTAELDDGTSATAAMWIKSARNEGLSVHVPSGNAFVSSLRDQSRQFSAYIPGLAGIPLSEERRAISIVRRLAAAGDANTVLRNVLYLLREIKIDKQDGLALVQNYVSKIMGQINIVVEFEEDRHATIQAKFQTSEMKSADPKKFKPIELAGVGFLQVIQIFAYLVYFRPVILLVDEPDSHLHPTAQERLVTVLAEAAQRFATQVVLTTHSPSVVRVLPSAARVIWMKNGEVQPNGDTDGRRLMGWGLLDRRILLMTEDEDVGMLQSLLSQWPDLDRLTAIWPFHGSSKLPASEVITGLSDLLNGSLKIMLHRDRDFLMTGETNHISGPYKSAGHDFWFTRCSDIEAYWYEAPVIAAHFGVPLVDAESILNDAVIDATQSNKDLIIRRKKRLDAMNKITAASKGTFPQFGDADVEKEATKFGSQHKVLGKDLKAAIRAAAQKKGYKNSTNFGNTIPNGLSAPIAPDLESALRALL